MVSDIRRWNRTTDTSNATLNLLRVILDTYDFCKGKQKKTHHDNIEFKANKTKQKLVKLNCYQSPLKLFTMYCFFIYNAYVEDSDSVKD